MDSNIKCLKKKKSNCVQSEMDKKEAGREKEL